MPPQRPCRLRRLGRLASAAAAGAACLAALAPAAQAAVKIQGVDATAFPTVRVTAVTSQATAGPPSLSENGRPVNGLRAQNLGRAKSVVLAIDRSQSMRGAPLARAIAAARAFLAAKPAADRIAVASFATRPLILTEFSTGRSDADGALRTIKVDPVQGTTLYDALVRASSTLSEEPLAARVVIVVTDGNETRSDATLTDAIEAARKAGTAVYVVAIESSKFNPEPLRKLAAGTGGAYRGTSSSAALRQAYEGIAAELRRTWRLEYATAARPGEQVSLRASAGALGFAASTFNLPGDLAPPTSAGKPPSRLLPDVFYETVLGTQLMSLITGLIILLAASLALTSVKGSRLKRRLAPHLVPATETRKQRARERERFAAAAGLFKATEGTFGHWQMWQRLERLIERADLPLRTVEFVYLSLGAALFVGLVGALSGASTFKVVLALAGGGSIPFVFVWAKGKRRTRAFENQLPDLLITLAAALKAGHSFKQGMQTLVDEGRPPASKELKRAMTEARLGRPLDDALGDMADRLGSKNFRFVITAVTIQRQVGGSLAGLIDMVADTVRQRQQFARKIKGLTAMGRAGAYVLMGLPFFIAGAITVINPLYMDPLYHTSTGHKLIYSGLAMMAVGCLALKKIVSFKG
jgi:tight adherence protein B